MTIMINSTFYLVIYGKCSKIQNISLTVLKQNVCFYGANREDPDQTASSEAVWSGSALFVKAFSPGN